MPEIGVGKVERSSTEMASMIADLRADLTKAKDLSQADLAFVQQQADRAIVANN